MRTATAFILALGLAGCETTKSESPAASEAPHQSHGDDTGDITTPLDCAAGEIAQEGECLPCEAGTYSPGGETEICQPCEPGTTDLDQDPSTECDACTEPSDDDYVINLCTPIRDTTVTECTSPEDGQRVAERCDNGDPLERGSDTILADCSNPEEGQYVAVECDPGAPSDRGSDTEIDDCSEPADGEQIVTPCDPGDYATAGSDATFAACTEPADGEYVVSPCAEGVDTEIATCSAATDGEYTAADCVAGDSTVAGSDTEIESCSTPGEGQYTETPCSASADSIIADCSTPAGGEYIATACEPGDDATAGSDATFATCTEPVDGEYVLSPCADGLDSDIASCSVATDGEYTTADCVAGDSTVAGSDTAIETCSTPGDGQYTDTPCSASTDTIIADCSTPADGEYIDAACAPGDDATAGSDATFATCTDPAGGEYVVSACADDADTVVATCSEPDAATPSYTAAICESGSYATLGSDTVVEDCTLAGAGDLPAASECITGSSSVLGSDRVPGGAADICFNAALNPDSVGSEATFYFAVEASDAWSIALDYTEGTTYCGTIDGLAAGSYDYFFAADALEAPTADYGYSSTVEFAIDIAENETTEDCNGWDTEGCELTEDTEEVDYCHIQYPDEETATSGDVFDAYLWVYEAGVTGDAGTGAGLEVDIGIGLPGDLPSDDWAWSPCTFNEFKPGLGGSLSNDEYKCEPTAPAVGTYDFAGRVSIDGGPWLYCDLSADFGGSGSSDGYNPATAGRLYSVEP